MSEEKKDIISEGKAIVENSDFADEEKPLPVPKEPKVEEKETPKVDEKPTNESEVNLHKEEPAILAGEEAKEEKNPNEGNPDKNVKIKKSKPSPVTYDYGDERLSNIEKDRDIFYHQYKKSNIWKYSVSAFCIAVIIIGYVLPLSIEAWKSYQMPITLSVLAAGVLGLGIFSYVSRKKIEVKMKDYFHKFYENTNAYVFSNPEVKNFAGAVEDKLPTEIFNAAGLYKDVTQVGSRASYQFDYKGLGCAISDAAGQTRGKKGALNTVFVGKFVQAPNTYKGGACIVYLKGNKRALPPTALGDYNLIEDHRDMVVYGETGAKRALTKKVRAAIAKFQTNDILCDMAISIKEGQTYIALGYEDTLMVLPMDKPFNPTPTMQYKGDMAKVFNLIGALNFKESEKK